MPKEKRSQPPADRGSKAARAGTSSRTEQRKIERQSERRRQRMTITAAAVGIVVLLAAILVIVGNTPAEAPIPDSAAQYDDLPQTVTERGYPRVGNIEGISVTMFNAFGCVTCDAFHNDTLPQLLERVRADEIALSYVPLRGPVTNGNGAIRSALCVAAQGKFFQYADALVTWVKDYGNNAFADNRLTTGAENLEIDMGEFHACRRSAPETAVLERGMMDLGDSRNSASNPPLILVNHVLVTDETGALSTDIADINRAIDDAIDFRAGLSQPTPEPTPDVEPTPEATAEPTAEPTTEPTGEATPEVGADDAEPTAAPTETSG